MLEDELVGSVPGYRIAGTTQEGGGTIVTLINEASGERFTIDALRIEKLAGGTSSLGKRIHEGLTLLAAGMPVEGVRKVEGGLKAGVEHRADSVMLHRNVHPADGEA